jgi:hypothetical protein
VGGSEDGALHGRLVAHEAVDLGDSIERHSFARFPPCVAVTAVWSGIAVVAAAVREMQALFGATVIGSFITAIGCEASRWIWRFGLTSAFRSRHCSICTAHDTLTRNAPPIDSV